MQRFKLDFFWHLAAAWNDSYAAVLFSEATDGEPATPLDEDAIRDLRNRLQSMKNLCDRHGLTTSARLLEAKISTLPKSSAEMDMLDVAIREELKSKLFLYVQPDRAAFFDREDLLGEAARVSYPSAAQELREAGNAFAVGLDTACVFHCMRALEVGIKSLAAKVGLSFDAQNWQNILDQIDKEILVLAKSTPAGPEKSARQQFLSEATNEFRHFKDGWRNYASHNKVAYDQNQSRRILDHVSSFLELLSKKLREVA